jgi:N-acetylglucosaminyldiphosphoundecaprenol N-acetyl-beta-D-mannosaminyltransferase
MTDNGVDRDRTERAPDQPTIPDVRNEVVAIGVRPSGRVSRRNPCVVLPPTGVAIDAITEAQTVEQIIESAAVGVGGLLVTPNIDHLHLIDEGNWLGAAYAEANLVVPDGMPLIWASRLLGRPLPERVTGSSLLWSLTAAAADAGISIFLLGGRPGAAEAAAGKLEALHPRLTIAGTSCPPRGFERTPGAIAAIVSELRAARPGIVFTALGAPKQELLNARLHRELPAMWFLGVGASLDMAAGYVHRAPPWAQRAGAEWVYRLVQEPRRMARRYLVRGMPYAGRLLFHSAIAGRTRGPYGTK